MTVTSDLIPQSSTNEFAAWIPVTTDFSVLHDACPVRSIQSPQMYRPLLSFTSGDQLAEPTQKWETASLARTTDTSASKLSSMGEVSRAAATAFRVTSTTSSSVKVARESARKKSTSNVEATSSLS